MTSTCRRTWCFRPCPFRPTRLGPSSFLALNGEILAFPRLLPGVFLRSVTLGCGDESIPSGPASGSSSVNS